MLARDGIAVRVLDMHTSSRWISRRCPGCLGYGNDSNRGGAKHYRRSSGCSDGERDVWGDMMYMLLAKGPVVRANCNLMDHYRLAA